MENQGLSNGFRLVIAGVALFIIFIIFLLVNPFVRIGAGERGVIFSNASGVQDRILDEGWQFRKPFVESVKTYSVRVQKTDMDAPAASKDLQSVKAKVVVNWHFDSKNVNKVYQSIGSEQDVIERIIIPNTNEVIKAGTAGFTADQLLTRRTELKDKIDTDLSLRLKSYFVIVDDVSIVDLDFSEQFNQAIESKVTAEQTAQAEKNKLETVKYQAQQKIETAKADAESIRIQAEALAQNDNLVNLKAVEKWDGKLPTQMLGDAVPFLNIK